MIKPSGNQQQISSFTSRKVPRISVNKLAEYLSANSTRRKQIVTDSKYPQEFITTRYKDARSAIKTYLIEQDELIIKNAIADLNSRTPDSDFQENDFNSSIQSLKQLSGVDISHLKGHNLSEFDGYNEPIKIGGVSISVNPDLIFRKSINGVVNVGAIKLHVSKTNTLSAEGQKVVAVMLHSYVESNVLVSPEVANTKLSMSFDVFQQTFECCPTSFVKRLKNIEAACEEIAMWWDKL